MVLLDNAFSNSNLEEYSMGYLGYAMAVALVALSKELIVPITQVQTTSVSA